MTRVVFPLADAGLASNRSRLAMPSGAFERLTPPWEAVKVLERTGNVEMAVAWP